MEIVIIVLDKYNKKPESPCCGGEVSCINFEDNNNNKLFFCTECFCELSKNNEVVYPRSFFNRSKKCFEMKSEDKKL